GEAGGARPEGQPGRLDQLEVGGGGRPDTLAAELQGPPLVELDLLHAAAYPIARLDHDDVRAAGREITSRAETGKAGAEDDRVVHEATLRSRDERRGRVRRGTTRRGRLRRHPEPRAEAQRPLDHSRGRAERGARGRGRPDERRGRLRRQGPRVLRGR